MKYGRISLLYTLRIVKAIKKVGVRALGPLFCFFLLKNCQGREREESEKDLKP